jgi:hypothetical protein
MDYRRHNVELLHARCDLSGRRVLEIGGDARGESARMLLDCGAREVIVTNRAHGVRNARIDPRIELRVVDARSLHEAFEPGTFDAAFGVAVAEHIPNPDGAEYHFSKPGNPLAPWQHLLHDEQGLVEALVTDKNLPRSHAEAIAAWVYRSDNINRISFNQLVRRMGGSGLQVEDAITNIYLHPDEATRRKLAEGALGADERYEVSGAAFVLRR